MIAKYHKLELQIVYIVKMVVVMAIYRHFAIDLVMWYTYHTVCAMATNMWCVTRELCCYHEVPILHDCSIDNTTNQTD
jgi:hypothetical protein